MGGSLGRVRDGNVRLEELAERHLEGLAEFGRDPEVQRYTYVPSPWPEGFKQGMRTDLAVYSRLASDTA
jgi:hypothetical protein